MPTGYTHNVGDGTLTDFPAFAMQCARAFGACITMRDDPSDTPIPEQFAPSPYYATRLEEARAHLARLEGMSIDEQEAACRSDNQSNSDEWDRRERERAETRRRYEAMLAHVESWQPPTSEHVALKSFMAKQLRESIDFDCGPPWGKRPVQQKRSDWFAATVELAIQKVATAEKSLAEEIERTTKRTEWVRALRQSLNGRKPPMPTHLGIDIDDVNDQIEAGRDVTAQQAKAFADAVYTKQF